MQRAEVRDDRRQQLRAIGRASDVSRPVLGLAAQGRQLLNDIRDRFARAETAERERPSLARERARDAEPDAARAAGDQRNLLQWSTLSASKKRVVGLAFGHPLDHQRRLTQMVIAPHA